MKLPRGPSSGNSGYYGGVGSKPAPVPWTPGSQRSESPAEPVPEKFRRVRLVRRRRDAKAAFELGPGLVVFIAVLLLVLYALLR